MIKCRENSNDISILIKPSFSVVAYGFILVFSIFSSAVQADSVKLSESQTEKVKCVTTKQDGKKYTECFKLTTGKFSITAKISPSTFENYGIVLEDITEETPLAINIGSFEFSEILSSDEKHVLKSNSLKGAWYRYHEVCKPKKVKVDGEWEELLICKDVKHTTTKVSASRSGATITVTGNSSGVEGYGDSVFNQLCSSEGTGIQKVPASIVVGDITIESNLAVNCRVNTKTQTAKTAQEFELVNMVINVKLAP